MVLPQMPMPTPAVPDPVQIAAASQQALINQQALLMVRTASTSQNLHVSRNDNNSYISFSLPSPPLR